MTFTQAIVCALLPLGIANTGALIYFAGVVTATLKSHGERLDKAGL